MVKLLFLFVFSLFSLEVFAAKNCKVAEHGNAAANCVCGDNTVRSTGDNCTPGNAGYNHWGSTAGCLEAFGRACTSGAWQGVARYFPHKEEKAPQDKTKSQSNN